MPSALAAGEAATTPSAARSVLASPLYRGATVALFLSGLGTSAAAPQITLFLVNDLHVSLTTAGLFYLTNITAPLAGYLIGARSDRSGPSLCRRKATNPDKCGRPWRHGKRSWIAVPAMTGTTIQDLLKSGPVTPGAPVPAPSCP